MLRDLRQELQEVTKTPAESEAKSGEQAEAPEPVLVQIQQPDASPLQTLREVGGPLVAPIATAGLVVVFVIFMLLQREDLRDRVLRLVGASDVARATEAMNDAARRISRYLLMQLVINVLYGIPIGIGLKLPDMIPMWSDGTASPHGSSGIDAARAARCATSAEMHLSECEFL